MNSYPKFVDDEIQKHTSAIARILGLDPVQYRVNISFIAKDDRPRFQELKR